MAPWRAAVSLEADQDFSKGEQHGRPFSRCESDSCHRGRSGGDRSGDHHHPPAQAEQRVTSWRGPQEARYLDLSFHVVAQVFRSVKSTPLFLCAGSLRSSRPACCKRGQELAVTPAWAARLTRAFERSRILY